MKTFIGMGHGNDIEAVRQATKGLTDPKMILFMAPYDNVKSVAKLINEIYPDAQSIGTIGTKFVNGKIDDKSIMVLGFFDDTKASCGVITEINKCPVLSVAQINKKMAQVEAKQDDTVCIEYCTGSEEMLVTTFNSCLGKKKIPLIGGTVFGVPDGKNAVVAYNGRVYEDACVYAFVKNLTGKVRVYKENIYENNSEKAHFATKVDVSRKALIELDGKPAASVYSNEIGIPDNKIIDNVLINPMGRVVGDKVFISSMMKLEKDGVLVNYKRINKNDCIYFLSLGDYDEIERNTREQIKHDMGKISLVLSVDCIYRYLLYNDKNYISTYAKDMAELGAHVGVVGGGEQYNNQHVNQTMVCAVFE